MRIFRKRTALNTGTQNPVEEESQFIPVGFEGITPAEPKLFPLEITPAEAAALGVPGPTVDVFWVVSKNLLGDGDPALFNSPYDMPLKAGFTLHADDAAYEADVLALGTDHLTRAGTIDFVSDVVAFTRDRLLFQTSDAIRPL